MIAGRDSYCGRPGSKESIATYYQLLAEYFNGNGAAPVLEGKPAGHEPALPGGGVQAVTVSSQGVHVSTSKADMNRVRAAFSRQPSAADRDPRQDDAGAPDFQ